MKNTLLVSPSPHIHAAVSTRSLMRDVIIALTPAIIVSILFYGWSELLVLAVSVVSCVLLEWAIPKYLLKAPRTIGGSGFHRGGKDDFRRNWPESI